ncbi:hypothetical protein AJ88_16555, partial [Mesorhizobium amorphae CCBAU 01583]
RGAQGADQIRQRVTEIAILALAETVTCHVDMTAEVLFVRIEGRDLGAFLGESSFSMTAQPWLFSSLASSLQS